MNIFSHSQRNLILKIIKSIIKYFIVIYLLIFCIGFFLELISIGLKNITFTVSLGIFFRQSLFFISSFLSISLPFVWCLSLFLTVLKLKKEKYFLFNFFRKINEKIIFISIFCIAIFICGINYLSIADVQHKLNNFIESEVRNIKFNHETSFIEPMTFNRYKDWVFYLPELNDSESKTKIYQGHFYHKNNERINIIARGSIQYLSNGDIILKNINGIQFSNFSKIAIYKKFKAIKISDSTRNYKKLRKTVWIYKNLMTSPSFPISLSTNKKHSPHWSKIKNLITIKFILLLASPIIFLLSLVMVFWRRNNCSYKTVFLYLWFFWCLFYLFGINLIEVSNNKAPDSKLLHSVFLSLFFLILFPDNITKYTKYFVKHFFNKMKLQKKKRVSQILKSKYYLGNEFLRSKLRGLKPVAIKIFNKFNIAQIQLIRRIIIYFSLRIIFILFLIISLLLIYRIYLSSELNYGIEYVSIFLLIEILDIFADALNLIPYIIVIFFPIFFQRLRKKNIIIRSHVSGVKNYYISMFIIFIGILLNLSAFTLLEKKGYHFKEQSHHLYNKYVRRYGKPGQINIKSPHFVLLPNRNILYYRYWGENSKENFTQDNIIDALSSEGKFYKAKKIIYKKENAYLHQGTIYKFNENIKSVELTSFKKHKIEFGEEVVNFIKNNKIIRFMTASKLKLLIDSGMYNGISTWRYLVKLYISRVLPFVTIIILICIFGLIIEKENYNLSMKKCYLISGTGFIVMLLINYIGLNVVIYF